MAEDLFKDLTNIATPQKQAKVAGASQYKQNKMSPNRLPSTLVEFAADKPNISLGEILEYENAFAIQTANDQRVEQERSGNFIFDTDNVMGDLGNLGVQFGSGVARTATQIAAAIPEAAVISQAKTISQGERNLFAQAEAKLNRGVQLTPEEESVYAPQQVEQTLRQAQGAYGDQFRTEADTINTPAVTSAYGAALTPEAVGTSEAIAEETTVIPTNTSVADKLKSEAAVKEYVTNPKEEFQKFIRSHVNTNGEDKLIKELGQTYDSSLVDFEEGNYAAGVLKLLTGAVGDNLQNPMAVAGFLVESLPQMLATSIRTPANIAYAVDTATKGIAKFTEDTGRAPTNEELDQIMAVSASAAAAEQVGAAKLFPKKAATKVAKESAVTEATRKIVGGGISEAATEGYQTAAEEVAGTLKPSEVDGKEVFTAAAIGGGIGKAIPAAGVAKDLVKVAGEQAAEFKGKVAKAYAESAAKAVVTDSKATSEAIKTGDIEVAKATGKPEVVVETMLDPSFVPKTEADRQTHIGDIKTEVNKLFDQVEAESDGAKQLAILDKAEALMERVKGLEKLSIPTPNQMGVEVDSIVEATEASPETDASIARVFGSMETSIGSVSIEHAQALADSDVVTPKQKKQLTEYIALEQAKESLEVNSDILTGGDGFLGIANYQNMIAGARKSGDTKAESKYVEQLTSFASNHVAKAELITDAFTAVVEGNPDAAGLVAQVQSDYGLTIHKNSNKGTNQLITNLGLESHALTAAVQQLSGKSVPAPKATKFTAPKEVPIKEQKVSSEITPKVVAKPITIKTADEGIASIKAHTDAIAASEFNIEIADTLKKNISKLHSKTPVANVQKVLDLVQKIASSNEIVPKKADENTGTVDVAKVQDADIAIDDNLPDVGEDYIDTTNYNPEMDSQNGSEASTTQATTEASTEIKPQHSLRGKSAGLRPNVYTATDVVTNGVDGTLAKNFAAVKNENSLLHTTADFFTEFTSDKRVAGKLNNDEEVAVTLMAQFAGRTAATVRELFKPLKGEVTSKKGVVYNQREKASDEFQFLADENGKLDENFLSTMAVVSMDWLASEAYNNAYNDKKDINKLLGNTEDTPLELATQLRFSKIGSLAYNIEESLGKAIVAAYGLKSVKGADGNLQGNMAVAVGQMAVASMLDAGWLTQNTMGTKEFESFKNDKAESVSDYEYVKFLRVATTTKDKREVPHDTITDMIDTLRKADNIGDKLFGTVTRETGPSFKAPKSRKIKVKGTFQVASTEQTTAIEAMQNRPWTQKSDIQKAFSFLGEAKQFEALGYVDDVDNTVHAYHRPGTIGLNNEIERSVRNNTNMLDKMIDAKDGLKSSLYFGHELWKNLRMGMISNTVNPQQDKLHRHTFGMSDWNIEIDPSTDANLVVQAKLAIAESLGVGVDKLDIEGSIAKYEAAIANPAIIKAVKVLNDIDADGDLEGEFFEPMQNILLAGIKAGGEKAWSLDGLVHLAKLQKGEKFEFSLFREIDGITNGVAIGMWQLAAADDMSDAEVRLNRMGIYFDENGDSFGKRAMDKSNLDSYQDLSAEWDTAMDIARAEGDPKLAALDNLMFGRGEATAITRVMSKYPLMLSNYGAAIKGIQESMAEDVISDIYKQLAKSGGNPHTVNNLIEDINSTTGMRFEIPAGEYLNTLMPKQVEQAIRDKVIGSFGVALEVALENKYGKFTGNSALINTAMGVVFKAFDIRYKRELDAQESAQGRILSKGERVDLVKSMYESVPLMNNYFSAKSGNREEMTFAMKTKSVRQVGDDRFKQLQEFARPVKGTSNPNKKGAPTKETKSYSSMDEYQDAGVSPAVLLIHGIDAATMATTMTKVSGLNVHDAIAFALDKAVESTNTFNEQFTDVMTNYSITKEVLSELENSIGVLKDEDANSGTDNIEQLNAFLLGEELGDVNDYLKASQVSLGAIDAEKGDYTKAIKRVSQYHTEGGEFIPSKAKSDKEIKESLAESLGSTIDNDKEIALAIEEVSGLVKKANEVYTVYQKPREPKKSGAKVTFKDNSKKVGKGFSIQKGFGSSEQSIDANGFNSMYSDDINAEKSEQLFNDMETMGNVQASPAHQEVLRDVLTGMVNKVIRPLKLKVKSEGNVTYGTLQGDNVFIVNGTGVLSNGTQMSTQEVFVHELVHSVTAAGIDGTSWASKELKKLFAIADKHIKPTDFLNEGIVEGHPDYNTELEAATERYNYIFRNTRLDSVTRAIADGSVLTGTTVRNNYLHEFVALGLTNENFMNALSKIDNTETVKVGATIGEKLLSLFNRILDFFTAKVTQTTGLKADAKLRALSEQLAGIDHRKKSMVYKHYDKTMQFTSDAVNAAVQGVTKPLVKLAGSSYVKGSKYAVVSATGKLGQSFPTATFEQYQDVMSRVRKNLRGMREGFFAQLSTEARGRTDTNGYMHTLGRVSNKVIDQTRLEIQTRVAAHLLKTFTTELTKDDKFALTRALLKTDISSVVGDYTMDEIVSLLESKAEVAKQIAKHEADLKQYGANKHFYAKQARNLGLMMATGNSREHLALRNAHNIAVLQETDGKAIGSVEEATITIDILATLHAINYTDAKSNRLAADVMKKELAVNPKDNGIVFMLKEHLATKEESAKSNFAGNERLIVKGYIKEIFDPSVSIQTVAKSEVAEMLKQNWRVIEGGVKRDPSDPTTDELVHMVNKDGLQSRYDSGVVSLTSQSANGTDLISIRAKGGHAEPVVTAQEDAHIIWSRKKGAIANMFSANDTRVKEGTAMLLQIHDSNGNVTGYRYTMSEFNKRKVLNKNDSFDDVLGGMAASIADKVNSEELNNRVVDALYKDYTDNYSKDPDAFVLVSSKSKNPALADIYNMMPQAMRDTTKAVFGTKEIWVRSDMVTLVFGQRKASVGNLKYTEDEDAIGLAKLQNQFNDTLVKLFNRPSVRTIEAVWQEVIKSVKDAIVIKSGVVTAGNIGSNLVLLKVLGVPMKDIVKNHGIAFNGALNYQKDSKELFELERDLERDHNVTDRRKMEARVAQLNNSIATNPVKDMIDAGIYQSIVEDIDDAQSQYSYATKLEKVVKPVTDRTPKLIKEAGKQVFLTHETKAYKFLRDAAQLSDFVARYTLHEHNMKVNGMSKEESTNMIIDTFINYDLPTHKAIQYLNDIGFVMFTKFFIRTQKVIFHIMKEHPANVLATVALQGAFGDVSDIVDSNALTTSVTDKFNYNLPSLVPTLVDIPTLNLLTGR